MPSIVLSFLTAAICTFFILKFQKYHIHLTSDTIYKEAQKIHTNVTSRIGGLGIFIGILFGSLSLSNYPNSKSLGLSLLFTSIMCFAIGISEDITKKISVRIRLVFTGLSAVLAIHVLNITIMSVDIHFLQPIFNFYHFQLLFTIFSIVGLSNAYNIIDGLNGLSSMIAIVAFTALSYVCLAVGDYDLLRTNAIICGAIIGFFIFNYPLGLIFLGDGGAYLLGFLISLESILLVSNNPTVSPWFPLLINIYPITETIFSVYRRSIHKNRNPMMADGTHIHTLIFRRIIKRDILTNTNRLSANARTSPYLWFLSASATIPALIFWNNTSILILICFVFISFYIWLYKRIINFKVPRWLVFKF